VETLARKSLKYPIEVMVGGRSVASDSVTQHAEVVEEEDKFLRLTLATVVGGACGGR